MSEDQKQEQQEQELNADQLEEVAGGLMHQALVTNESVKGSTVNINVLEKQKNAG